jgi:filamentous hemagglutinin
MARLKNALRHRGKAAGSGVFVLFALGSASARPPLPTPCIGGNCGTSATTFAPALTGTAGAAVIGNTLTVTQTTSKAILNWADFNIANGYKVNFVQPSATAAVLNKIWSSDPSVIAGQLTANGQVYLYNQNGIVFDKGAQVNVAGLVASTLKLSDTTFENGILSNTPAGTTPLATFTAPDNGAAGAVNVNAGATLATTDGGRIMLLGSAVTNSGSISAPDGQVILGAATKNVYLAASENPQMRGLLIEVDGGGTTGTVTNDGQISTPRGNVTLAGLIVNQQGTISATTSVSANGSIYLVAGDTSNGASFYTQHPLDANKNPTAFGGLLPNKGGTLTLASGSVTEVLPDATDTGTLNVAQQASFSPSQVDLAGKVIALEGTATVHAPGGTVNVYAAANPEALVVTPTQPVADGGSIYVDKGATIDVSGLADVAVPVTQNLIQVTLETNDLQNDPLQRAGFLHGTTVTVDVNSSPPLFDVTPYANNIGSNINQLLTKAGSIQLNATGDVITRAGSTLNVSGGSIAYQGGYGASTTNLLGADGKVYNISTAPTSVQYVAVANGYSYTDPTWGTTTKGNGQSYYAGYTQGENAGSIVVESQQVYLRGSMLATTVAGLNQRDPATLAAGGTFELGCSGCTNPSNIANFGVDGGITFTDNLQDTLNGNVVLNGNVISSTNIPAISLLSPTQLTQSGFNTIGVYSNGPVVLPAGTNITPAANGNVAMKSAQSIDVNGNIYAPGGTVSLLTANTGDSLMHDISVGTDAVIDVSGGWTNDSPVLTPLPGTAPTVIKGGSVSANAAGDVVLRAGSLINVSGGGWLNQSNQLSTGAAGQIALTANFSLPGGTPATDPFTGTIVFARGATLLGASLDPTAGGTLSLAAGSITVGTVAAGTPGELLLQPSFFTRGGFAQYNIVGQNDVVIGNLKDTTDSAPVTISPLQQTLVFSQSDLHKPTGSDLRSFTQLATLPVSQRAAASVSFAATASDSSRVEIGDVTLAKDASILTDPGASVTLAANGYNGSVRVFGTISAPAGTILLQVDAPTNQLQSGADPGFLVNQDIELGPAAVLSAPAYPMINTLDQLGYRQGSVLTGGSVSLVANKGFVVTDPGSLINVSGAVGILDIAGPGGVTPTIVAGNAGTINIDAREGIVLQGNLLGEAATLNGAPVAGAGGGTLNVGLGNNYSNAGSNGTGAENISVGILYPTDLRVVTLVGTTATGAPAVAPSNQQLSGSAFINVSTIENGGFDAVAIRSADDIAFAGTVALHTNANLTLDAPVFEGAPGAAVTLSSAYVAVGNHYNNGDYFDLANPSPNAAAVLSPTTGTSTLSVNAQLIDIRGISGWSGFATENFDSAGDIRFVAGANTILAPPAVHAGDGPFEGAFNTSATLNLQGAQLYPTTATAFAINDSPSVDPNTLLATPTLVTITSSQAAAITPATPLSAGGSISINATDITQSGVLRAPLGQISLNGVSILDAAGAVVNPGSVTLTADSLTSVSADGLVIPYGSTVNGSQWTYSPAVGTTNAITLTTPPVPKQITLNGSAVLVNSGARVDLSGGGDLYAYEFIAGQGGAVDVLSPASVNSTSRPPETVVYSYAILPSLGSAYAPIDAQYAQGSLATTGQTIYLSGVPGLAAGTYALLPATYALLPGAFAVQIVAANSAIAAGSAVQQANGSYITAGRLGVAGTSVLDSLTSTVLVASDAVVRTESQYTDSYANAFFTSAAIAAGTVAPRLPADAGQLILAATNRLDLNGSVNFAVGSFLSGTDSSGKGITQTGLGGDVAITAQNIVVVDATASQGSAPAGTVQLNVQQLDNLDAQTLILGAISSTTPAGELLTLGSPQTGITQTVELKNTTPLTAPQVILAALDSVTVDSTAQLIASGSGTSGQAPTPLLLPGGGALLRASSGAAATLVVDPTSLPTPVTGTVAIGAGANVQASGSLLLYGTANTTLAPGALIGAPAVGLYSSAISVGDVPAGTSGLTLSQQLLGSLQGLTDLTLGSSSTINFYGTVALGTPGSAIANLNSITLDAAGLGGYGAGAKTLQAGSITLINSGTSSVADFSTTPDGTGALALVASATGKAGSGQITLGSGAKTVSGFSSVSLQADGDIVGQGTGSLIIASTAPVSLTSAAVIGTAASTQTITTPGALTITAAAPSKLTLPAAGLGAALTILAGDITQNGTIDLPAGSIALTASSGNVTLGSGSLTAAAGAVKSYTVTDAVASGGSIALTASGNVAVSSGAVVDVSGASSPSGSVNGGAGSLSVSAPLGTFSFAGTLKGSAAVGQQQGGFSLDEGSGLGGSGFSSLTTVLANSGFTGAIDLRTRNDASVVIADTVHASSFQLAVDQGSIEVTGGGVINTSGGTALDTGGGAIALWAGTGLTLDAGAQLLANAGAAGPAGASGVALAAHGGDITLGTAAPNSYITIVGGSAQQPTLISMQGSGAADTDGTLTLRAPRTPDDLNVQITVNTPFVNVVSRKPVVVEGVRTYWANDLGSSPDSGCGTGGSCNIGDQSGVLFTDAATFAANSAAIAGALKLANVQVRPGIEVDSSGDLILDNSTPVWDLASWDAALGALVNTQGAPANLALGAPVNLTLRAAGNLIFNTSLSDGFTSPPRTTSVVNWTFGEPGSTVDSASYRLTGGADVAAANPLAVVVQAPGSSLGAPPNSGNVILTPNNLIRTGNGSIQVAAGGDVLLGYSVYDSNGNLYDNGVLQTAESDPLTAAIYTAGVPSVLTPAQTALFTVPNTGRKSGSTPSYPTDGGNISVTAADDIRSDVSAQLVSDWLWRRGPTDGTVGPSENTSWWIMFNAFKQGIGALGGGNVALNAGRDIVNTSAVIPSTGRMIVAATDTPVAADLVLTGGGNLSVHAGGDIVSGVFEDDWGNASITAGGALTSSALSTFGQATATIDISTLQTPPALSTEIYPILVVGNGVFDVSARSGIALDGVTNSTTLPITKADAALGSNASFFTYAQVGNPSTLDLTSAAGDVTLNRDAFSNLPIVALSNVGVVYQGSTAPSNYLSVFPSTVNVASLAGDINLGINAGPLAPPDNVNITLFPAPLGNLNLLAAGSINNDGQIFGISMSEANPALVPNPMAPQGSLVFGGVTGIALPQVPLHQADTQSISIVADTGNIESGAMIFPKAANLIAGGNLTDINFLGKNLNPSDVTLISAGGDITYSNPTLPITNALISNSNGIQVAGPGYLEVLAGKSINLGDGNGIVTSGSLSDSRLPAAGAAVVVGAGFGNNADGSLRPPAYQSFINTYLAPDATTGAASAYASTLVGYMQQLYPVANATITYAAALTAFEALTTAQQLPLISEVLSDELSATGLAHTIQGASYARGYAAINTLFPVADANKNPLTYSGDLNLFYSQVKTEQGGNIDLLVPGGSVVVGVPNPPASLSQIKVTPTPDGVDVPAEVNLGILVLGQGAVQGFADQNFEVNQSRILTLEGGDIILWASNGDIDAGKGAKSAAGAPPPVIATDTNGNLFVDPSNAVSGSGIGQLLTTPGIKAGLVNLIAPKGVVNAGDAGIRVAGNLNIAAVQVIGAGNISVVGTSTGVPVSDAGALAGALSGANALGDASKSAVDQLAQNIGTAANYQQLTDSLQPTFITVKMFCLGVECEAN